MLKSVLFVCMQSNLEDLGWIRVVVQHGLICHHLGYPIDWYVSNVKIIDCISRRIYSLEITNLVVSC